MSLEEIVISYMVGLASEITIIVVFWMRASKKISEKIDATVDRCLQDSRANAVDRFKQNKKNGN